jgi:hypothetical protein
MSSTIQVSSLDENKSNAPNKVSFYVGGQRFTTTKATLQCSEYFRDLDLSKDSDIDIDKDPEVFKDVLECMRNGGRLSSNTNIKLLSNLHYFGINIQYPFWEKVKNIMINAINDYEQCASGECKFIHECGKDESCEHYEHYKNRHTQRCWYSMYCDKRHICNTKDNCDSKIKKLNEIITYYDKIFNVSDKRYMIFTNYYKYGDSILFAIKDTIATEIQQLMIEHYLYLGWKLHKIEHAVSHDYEYYDESDHISKVQIIKDTESIEYVFTRD